MVFISLQFFDRSNTKQDVKEDKYKEQMNQLEIKYAKVDAEKAQLLKEISDLKVHDKVSDSLRIANDNIIKNEIKKIKNFTPVTRANHVDSVLRAAGIRQ